MAGSPPTRPAVRCARPTLSPTSPSLHQGHHRSQASHVIRSLPSSTAFSDRVHGRSRVPGGLGRLRQRLSEATEWWTILSGGYPRLYGREPASLPPDALREKCEYMDELPVERQCRRSHFLAFDPQLFTHADG